VSGTPSAADHEAFDELAVGWALHALEPEEETLFARHLPDCARCARTVAETEEVMAALATDLPPAEPSEELRSRLRTAVEQTEQVHRPPVVPPPPMADDTTPLRGRRRSDQGGPLRVPPARAGAPGAGVPGAVPQSRGRLSPLRERGWAVALAAAVAGVVGLGIWNVSLSSARDRAVEAAAEQQAVVQQLLQPGAEVLAQLRDPVDGGDPLATVVVRDGDVRVVSQALAVNDRTDETYVLWGISEGSDEPEAIGPFDVVRSRLDVDEVGSAGTGSDDYETYAVSLEPGRQAPAEPSGVVAIGQVTS
jgi:anti-sigma-K factor RskA